MNFDLPQVIQDEKLRNRMFPVTAERVFLAHAGVAALPRVTAGAMTAFAEQGSKDQQEAGRVWSHVLAARKAAARLLGCDHAEVALLAPTALGLNLVANGLPWQPGDEVIYYQDDYPANVYPWLKLKALGVHPVSVEAEAPGVITWETISGHITDRTKLVALASCNFLSGYRIDIDEIGRRLHERNILFCLDGIQTLGAFPVSVEHVDFLSADSHKWLLGPAGAGIFYVKAAHFDLLKPTLLGAWNVVSPEYIAQDDIIFYEGARRYEPGTLNMPGIIGMLASLELILETGIERIGVRILDLRRYLLRRVEPLGYGPCLSEEGLDDTMRSGIITLTHPDRDIKQTARHLQENKISVSLRYNRNGQSWMRVSPHFYNTEEEIDRYANMLDG